MQEINDTHIEVKDCDVCGDHKEENGTCSPIGELQYIRHGAYVFEYYECEFCKDECRREYHTTHRYGPWEDYGDLDDHRKACGCSNGDDRYLYEEHDYECQETDDE